MLLTKTSGSAGLAVTINGNADDLLQLHQRDVKVALVLIELDAVGTKTTLQAAGRVQIDPDHGRAAAGAHPPYHAGKGVGDIEVAVIVRRHAV